MTPEISSLAKKFQIKAGMSLLVLNAPGDFPAMLAPLPTGVTVATSGSGPFDAVHCFARNSTELERYAPVALAALKPDGMLWFAYPKGTSGIPTDLSRDNGWDAATVHGWEGIRQIAVDDVWSAVRFRPNAQRGSDELLEKHFAGPRAALRPVYDRLIGALSALGDDVTVGVRDSYVAFARRKQFAVFKGRARPVQAELGLRLPDVAASPRLAPAGKSFGSESATHVVVLTLPEDIDHEVLEWLRRAYEDVG